MKKNVILGLVLVSVTAIGIASFGIPSYLNKREHDYRFEAQMALISAKAVIPSRVWPGDPAPREKILETLVTRGVAQGLRMENGTLLSENGRYRIDFEVAPEPTYIDEQGAERLQGYTLRATAIDPERNRDCQWYSIDGANDHSSGPAPYCWFLAEYANLDDVWNGA